MAVHQECGPLAEQDGDAAAAVEIGDQRTHVPGGHLLPACRDVDGRGRSAGEQEERHCQGRSLHAMAAPRPSTGAARVTSRKLPAHEPGREAEGVMGLLTGVVERVPAAYYGDERQAILQSARGFGL